MTIERSQNIKLGVLYGIISAFSFATMSVLAKLTEKDLPVSMLIFFRFGTSLILIVPWILADRHFSFKINQPLRYGIRILAALLALFCIFYAIKLIPLVDALLLNNTTPLFVPIIAFLITGAKTPRKAISGIVLGFIGVDIILNPGKEIFSSTGSLIAFASGILSALAIVELRLISKTSSIKQMLFYYFLVSTIIAGILTLLEWKTPENLKSWLLLLGIGLFGTLYQLFATLSYVTAPVRLMSSLVFLVLIFGGLFDWLLWGNLPSSLTVIGAIFVVTGSIITVYFGQKEILVEKK